MRRAARTDANHAEIVQAFKDRGFEVFSLAGVGNGAPDLLVYHLDWPVSYGPQLVEIKDGSKPPSARKLRVAQVDFHKK